MEAHAVLPDVIDMVPLHTLEVRYANNVEVNMGNELTPSQVKDLPVHLSWPKEEGALYTLCMTDPDAPSRKNQKFGESHHWLVVNIPENDVQRGKTLSEYVGTGDPKGGGVHRYVFLVYKQPRELKPDESVLSSRSADNRTNFKTTDFAKKYNLGNPIAGNFFQVQLDDYVSKLYNQSNVKL
ncbi:phosphatidylethanolamine-binding-like protein [Dinothrombium tinctorium]|uniref:Phosphatidylethanolamine-binding-like protein n=1 Tax=Dinothrombium tinctorium TaxID=1965070 RepID=A0A3S3P7K8_9ACAR|nr:phosphatidylethanolamine-binding-like protein [Dinothrombium tinctorium]